MSGVLRALRMYHAKLPAIYEASHVLIDRSPRSGFDKHSNVNTRDAWGSDDGFLP